MIIIKNYVLEDVPNVSSFDYLIDEFDTGGYKVSFTDKNLIATTVRELIEIVKTKNLTVRQAQEVFLICSEHVLNCKCD